MSHTLGPIALKAQGVIIGGPFTEYTNGSAQSQLFMAMTGPGMDPEKERDANAERIVLLWNLAQHMDNDDLREATAQAAA